MNTQLDCLPCLVRQCLHAARDFSPDPAVHERALRELMSEGPTLDLSLPPSCVARRFHARLRALTGVDDPYAEAKRRFNRLALLALPELRAAVARAADPLLAAARCAVAANAIDMGLGLTLTEAAVREALRGLADGEPAHGDWEAFRRAAAAAPDILYVADNAGELAVDRLAVEQLGPGRVTVAVRGGPASNDATLADAREVGLTELCEVIDTGSDVPGVHLPDCSPAFRRRFERAALIVAKGQGNYETLEGVRPMTAFWFKVKCPAVSRLAGLPMGAHALLAPRPA